MQIENAETATLISKHLDEIERFFFLIFKETFRQNLKKYNEVLINSEPIFPLINKKLVFSHKK